MLPHDVRQFLIQRLRSLSKDEAEYLQEATPKDRIKWCIDVVREAYPNLNYKDIAKTADITRQAIWHILNDKVQMPSAHVVQGLSKALGVPVSFFMVGLIQMNVADAHLPPDILHFIVNPANREYVIAAIELAKTLSQGEVDPKVLKQVESLALAIRGLPAEAKEA